MGATMDTAMERGRLSLPLLLRLMPSPDMDTVATDMATDTVTAMATATDMATVMDTDTARGRLSLPPLLRLMPLPVTATAMATARGRLSLPPLLRLLLSPDMDTATDTATDTVTGTATATDTADMAAMATMDTDTARGRLSLPPLLRLMPMPTTDT